MKRLTHVFALLALTACAAHKPEDGAPPTDRQFSSDAIRDAAEQEFAVYDPAEGTNKYIYKFNAELDRWVLIPVVDVYTDVTPKFLRIRVGNFFRNVGEFGNFTNAVLQAKLSDAATTLGRFTVNTTVGLLGTFDVATGWGMPRHPEDFGLTLGNWGVGAGPYIVLPFFGPSNLRDTTGLVVDLAAFSLAVPNHIENTDGYRITEYGVQPVDMRYENSFRYFESGSPFEYETVRYVVSHAREAAIAQKPEDIAP